MSGLRTCFSSPGLLLQGHQQGGQDQLHPVGAQVPHHSLGTVICSLEEEEAGVKPLDTSLHMHCMYDLWITWHTKRAMFGCGYGEKLGGEGRHLMIHLLKERDVFEQ